MPWSLRWSIALRQTLDPGKGLSAFLSRVSIVGMALRSTIVHPTVATEKPSNPGNSALFESVSYTHLTLPTTPYV